MLSNKGKVGDVRIISEETWRSMHSHGRKRKDFGLEGLCTEGISPSEFTQGGVNCFRVYPEEPAGARRVRLLRSGFCGWMGYGGSVLQWHPGLHVGFAYAPTLWAWYDPANTRGAELQYRVRRCAAELRRKRKGSKEDGEEPEKP